MKYIGRFKKEILIVFLIFLAFFALRLPNLTLLPIFADEAIYIRWAQVMRAEPTLRFLPLSDGKTPLFMWSMIPLFKVFEDPLFAGRFLSVISGFVTLLGVLFLGWKFFHKRVGIWAAMLIAVTPFMVFFDRLALVDSMMAAFTIWSLNLALLLIKYPRIDLAFILGYFLGGGLLTKPPAFFNILLLPLTLINFDWLFKNRQNNFLKIFGLWIIAIVTTLGIYNILRLGPGFVNLNSRNQDYVHPPTNLLINPLDPLIPHAKDLIDWLPKFFGMPVLILVLIGLIMVVILRKRTAVIFFLWALAPLLIQAALLKTFTARYILSSIPLLLVLAAIAIDSILLRFKYSLFTKSVMIVIILASTLNLNYFFLVDPSKAWLPRGEREGYLERWTAGYEFKTIANYLIEKSQQGMVVVGTDGSFGTLPDGLQIYLDKHSHTAPLDNQVIVIGGKGVITEQIRNTAFEHQTYFLTNRPINVDMPSGLEKVLEYPKVQAPNGYQESIILWKVLPIREPLPLQN